MRVPSQNGEPPRLLDLGLVSPWVDSLNVQLRQDGIAQVRLFCASPEAIYEVGRFQSSVALLKKLHETLSSILKTNAAEAGDDSGRESAQPRRPRRSV